MSISSFQTEKETYQSHYGYEACRSGITHGREVHFRNNCTENAVPPTASVQVMLQFLTRAIARVTRFRFSDSGILYFQPDNHLLCLFSTRIIIAEDKFYYLLKQQD